MTRIAWGRAVGTLLLAVASPVVAQAQLAPGPNKTGVGPTAVMLPSGPGSITGFGAGYDWRVAGNKGAYRYSIEVAAPPGPAGIAPAVSVTYGTDLGMDSLGLGWRLDLPFVERDTTRRLPVYDGTSARLGRVFPEDGGVFLTEDGARVRRDDTGAYFAEHERSFVRYRREGEGWRAQYPDGQQLFLGVTARARLQSADGARVFRWLPERLVDPHGNEIGFVYADDTVASAGTVAAKRLVRIDYGAGAPPWQAGYMIRFDYERRPEALLDGRPGFLVENASRLSTIEVLSQGGSPAAPGVEEVGDYNGDGIGERLVRRYEFGYAEAAMAGSVSLLKRVTEFGRDGVSSLPSTTFEYTGENLAPDVAGSVTDTAVLTAWPDINARVSSAAVELADVNADALPDLLVTPGAGGGPHLAVLNLGRSGPGTLNAQLGISSAVRMGGDAVSRRVTLASARQDATLTDFNGDGRVDLGYRGNDRRLYYFPGDGAAGWGPGRRVGDRYIPRRFFGDDSPVRQADLDGDRRIDLVRTESGGRTLGVWYSLETGDYSERVAWVCPEDCDFRQGRTRLTDVTGDGLADLVWMRSGAIRVAPGLGFGRFARVRELHYPGRASLSSRDLRRARLIDVTGDGLSDLVIQFPSPDVLLLAVNRGTAELGPWITINDAPAPFGRRAKIRWADMTGDGAADYVLLEDTRNGPRVTVLDVLRALGLGTKPNLMSRVDNGRGRVTEIAYTTAAEQMRAARAAEEPWRTTVPNPLVLVASVSETTYPHETPERTRYVYRDGIYARDVREHRGFETVESVSVGREPDHPTQVTRTRFERGDDHDALQGLARLVTVMDEHGRRHEETETVWSKPPRALRFRSEEAVSHFAYPRHVISRLFDADPAATVTRLARHAYDDAGNLVRLDEDGVVNAAGEPLDLSIGRTTLTEFIVDEDRWMLRAPRREVLLDARGDVQTETLHYYDDESFELRRLGGISRGLLTMTRRRVTAAGAEQEDPTDAGDWITDARHRYDAYGNRVLTAGALARVDAVGGFSLAAGNWSWFEIDPVWRSRVIGETVVVDAETSLTHRFEYDHDFGLLSAHTDPAGARSRYDYDVFGRLSAISYADDAPGLPSERYRYAAGVTVPDGGTISWVDTMLLDAPAVADDGDGAYFVSRGFIDGTNRALYTKLEGSARPEARSGAVITGVASFTERGATFETLMPCAARSQASALAWENPFDPSWRCNSLIDGTWHQYGFAEAPKTRRTYDAFDREIETLLPDGEVRRIRYRPLERRMEDEKAVRGTASALTYAYDGFDRLVAMIEEPHLDVRGRETETRETWRTTYRYDAADRLVSIRDSEGAERTASFDLLGRVVAVESPAFGSLGFTYDPASRQVRRWDGAGRETTFDYDGAGRLRLVRSTLSSDAGNGAATAPSVVRYTYDVPHHGYLTRVDDRLGVEELSYDSRGRVTRMERRFAPDLGGAVLTLGESYDAMDRPVTRTFPDGDRLRFDYDERNLLSSLTLDSVGVIAAGATYSPAEQLVSLELGNGLTRTHAYDRRGRLRRTAIARSGAATPMFSERLGLDASSNIVERVRTRGTVRQAESFGHDELHRLVSTTWSRAVDGVTRRAAYRYSAAGDLLALEQDGVALPLDVTRDASGRVVRTARGELTWNSDGHLATVRHADLRLENLYDGSGRRGWSRMVDEASDSAIEATLWPWPGYEIRNGRATKRIDAFGGLLASVGDAARAQGGGASPEISYYHADHLGSPILRLGDDGQVLGQRAYGAYGEVLDEQGLDAVSEGFTGAPYERPFDLSVFEARAMAGATGRFLSPDPVVLHVASPPLSPQALNPFSYSLNRPLTHVDPDGRSWSLALDGAFIVNDVLQWRAGNLSNEQFWTSMAITGASIGIGALTAGAVGSYLWRSAKLGGSVGKSARTTKNATRITDDVAKRAVSVGGRGVTARQFRKYVEKRFGKRFKGWEKSYSDGAGGVIYHHDKSGYNVRIMQRNASSDWASQRVDYVRVHRRSEFVDKRRNEQIWKYLNKSGKEVRYRAEKGHIPLDEGLNFLDRLPGWPGGN